MSGTGAGDPPVGNVRPIRGGTRTGSGVNGQDSIDLDDLSGFDPPEIAETAAKAARPVASRSGPAGEVLAKALRHPMIDSAAAKVEVKKVLARDAARRAVSWAQQPPAEAFDIATLREVMARPAEPLARIEGLLPWSSSQLVVAQRKAGKTTLLLNQARALLTGEPFLGRFDVRPIDGAIGFLNFEVTAAMLARWAAVIGVDEDRLVLANMRGRRNPFRDPEDAERLAKDLRRREVETLIVDPFGRAYGGESQNDAGEVGNWLVELDRFARIGVGAIDLVLTCHAGWNGERTRGSSALEDWADTIVNVSRDEDDPHKTRYLRAIGRGVDVDESALIFDQPTMRLSLDGFSGGRQATREVRRRDEIDRVVLAAIETNPGLTIAGIEEAIADAGIAFQKGAGSACSKRLIGGGQVVRRTGPRNAQQHYLKSNTEVDAG